MATEEQPTEDVYKYMNEKIKTLEERNSRLSEEVRSLNAERRFHEHEKSKMEAEIRRLQLELNKLRNTPLIVGYVEDVLVDGTVVVKGTNGPHFVVPVAEFVEKTAIIPGTRVSMNNQTLAVVGVLPPSKDPLVYGAEIVEKPDVTYGDVGGLEAQTQEIRETVELSMTKPELFDKVGITPPKGVLLYGLPGTGKTMLAKAVANQTNATFIRVVGSELVQKYIGEGARMVKELFKLARDKAPTVMLIDEMDAIGARRLEDATSGDREVNRTLMQLLAEMDGFDPRGDVKILGATNRIDILDPALLRPGRFDRLIEVPMPDLQSRIAIFKIHTEKMNLEGDVELKTLATKTDGASGAEIQAICMEAGMFAIRTGSEKVSLYDFESAIKKVISDECVVKAEPGQMFA